MDWKDQSEYAYKNGYDKGQLELIEEINKQMSEKANELPRPLDSFGWGEIHGMSLVQEILMSKKRTLLDMEIKTDG